MNHSVKDGTMDLARSRAQPQDRLEDLVRAGAIVFARRGYRRTQMADVAREMGVSPGNLYNYVDSKDALFYLVLRRMFGERPGDRALELPVTGASVTVTSEWVAKRLDFVSDFPELERALARRRSASQDAEVEAIVGELYDVLARMRLGVDMIERSVEDLPALAEVFGELRRELFTRYERYLRQKERPEESGSQNPRPWLTSSSSCAGGRRVVGPTTRRHRGSRTPPRAGRCAGSSPMH